MAAPVLPKPRQKRGIEIINPNTGKSIFADEPPSNSSSSATANHQTPPAEPAQVTYTIIYSIGHDKT
jgi:hypothetical protein